MLAWRGFLTLIVVGILYPGVSLAQFSSYNLEYLEAASGPPTPPGMVDIIVEADTHTPNFYKGRAEPSSGNPLRLVALPSIANVDPDTLTFAWTIDGTPLTSRTQSITVTAPSADRILLGLRVSDKKGNLLAEKDEYISISNPQILFYEENQLRGLSHTAIPNEYVLIGDEASIVAEPYFIGRNDTPPALLVDWTIDGQKLLLDNNWKKINFTRPNVPVDQFKIDLTLRHQTKLSEQAEGKFTLRFEI